jgi:hypothetical protein
LRKMQDGQESFEILRYPSVVSFEHNFLSRVGDAPRKSSYFSPSKGSAAASSTKPGRCRCDSKDRFRGRQGSCGRAVVQHHTPYHTHTHALRNPSTPRHGHTHTHADRHSKTQLLNGVSSDDATSKAGTRPDEADLRPRMHLHALLLIHLYCSYSTWLLLLLS